MGYAHWCSLTAFLSASPAFAAYLTPAQAGFHDCALIYERPQRAVEDLMPLVARVDRDGRPVGWLFDSFLFLRYSGGPSTGASYYNGPTNQADWTASLDTWFEPDRDLAALDGAVRVATAALGPRPGPLQVIISIHYPSRGQKDFGDVDGDGVSEDLSRQADREKAVRWYIDEARGRFERGGLPNLALWGFYWMNEDTQPTDAAVIRSASSAIHERGLRFAWIPYYRAAGFDRCKELGFDAAFHQPNYAFVSDHKGRVRSDRLVEASALAEQLDMGVEIEIGYAPDTDLRTREIFYDYLAFGAPELCGYQQGAKAYYFSLDIFPRLAQAADAGARATYDALCDFIEGKRIAPLTTLRAARATAGAEDALDDAPLLADGLVSTVQRPDGRTARLPGTGGVVVVEFGEPTPLAEIEVGAVRQEGSAWSGQVTAEIRRAADGPWEPGGWARGLVPQRVAPEAARSVIAVPLPGEPARAVRFRFEGAAGAAPLEIDEITRATPFVPHGGASGSLSFDCPYIVSPSPPQHYPDRGGQLTDGLISTEGFGQGRSVGWHGQMVTLLLDLGAPQTVDGVVVHCDGGGYAAVNFPATVEAVLYAERPPACHRDRGLGAAPALAGDPLVADQPEFAVDHRGQGGENTENLQGHLAMTPARAVDGVRWVSLRFQAYGWLMVSEVEVLSRDRNVAQGVAYHYWPQPSAAPGTRYADDGLRLTDGVIAEAFDPALVAGWSEVPEAQVTVDLGEPRPIRQVTAHTLGGGRYGIVAPSRALLEVSTDGQAWVEAGAAGLTDPGGDTLVPMAAVLPAAEGTLARHVRVRLQGLAGWAMLSEIEVR